MKLRGIQIYTAFGLLVITVLGSGSASAQPQYVQSRPVEGSHSWRNDGWCYVLQRGQWVRTNYQRMFPDPRNPHVYDLYDNGRYTKRVDHSQPGWVKELPAANQAANAAFTWLARPVNAAATDANIWILMTAGNRWVTLADLKASGARTQVATAVPGGFTGLASSVIGGTSGPVITYVGPSSPINATAAASVLGGVR